jgi:hypothetical protein
MSKKKAPGSAKTKRGSARKVGSPESAPKWAVLQGEELSWPGAPLLALLIEAGNTRGLSSRELAEQRLGITYSHFQLLRKGERSMSKLQDETLDRIAAFLGLPKVIVMLAGGQLRLEDFYPDPSAFEQQLESALRFIQRDPEFGPYMPPSTFAADAQLRRFILMLYEKASGTSLIPSGTTVEGISKGFRPIK